MHDTKTLTLTPKTLTLTLRIFKWPFFIQGFFTVMFGRLSKRGATRSLAWRDLQQFSPNNALVLRGIIVIN